VLPLVRRELRVKSFTQAHWADRAWIERLIQQTHGRIEASRRLLAETAPLVNVDTVVSPRGARALRPPT